MNTRFYRGRCEDNVEQRCSVQWVRNMDMNLATPNSVFMNRMEKTVR